MRLKVQYFLDLRLIFLYHKIKYDVTYEVTLTLQFEIFSRNIILFQWCKKVLRIYVDFGFHKYSHSRISKVFVAKLFYYLNYTKRHVILDLLIYFIITIRIYTTKYSDVPKTKMRWCADHFKTSHMRSSIGQLMSFHLDI